MTNGVTLISAQITTRAAQSSLRLFIRRCHFNIDNIKEKPTSVYSTQALLPSLVVTYSYESVIIALFPQGGVRLLKAAALNRLYDRVLHVDV